VRGERADPRPEPAAARPHRGERLRDELWVDREPFRFAEDITTNLYIAVSSQDEQTGGRAGAILEALDLDRDDRVVRYSGANGTHVEALSPELLGDLVEFLELYVAERTPVLTERPDVAQLRFALRSVYAGLLGTEGLPSAAQLPLRPDRFAGMRLRRRAGGLRGGAARAHPVRERCRPRGLPGLPGLDLHPPLRVGRAAEPRPGLRRDGNTLYLRDGGDLTDRRAGPGDADQLVLRLRPHLGQPADLQLRLGASEQLRRLAAAARLHGGASRPRDEHLSFVTEPLEETA
jgi:hypothetical protein